jgi:hypothetical protein
LHYYNGLNIIICSNEHIEKLELNDIKNTFVS